MRLNGDNERLAGEGNVPFDTPETWRPKCRAEAKLGERATGHVRAMMPANLCIIGRGSGGYGIGSCSPLRQQWPGHTRGAEGAEGGEGVQERELVRLSNGEAANDNRRPPRFRRLTDGLMFV